MDTEEEEMSFYTLLSLNRTMLKAQKLLKDLVISREREISVLEDENDFLKEHIRLLETRLVGLLEKSS